VGHGIVDQAMMWWGYCVLGIKLEFGSGILKLEYDSKKTGGNFMCGKRKVE
jgi:hypothetical protein